MMSRLRTLSVAAQVTLVILGVTFFALACYFSLATVIDDRHARETLRSQALMLARIAAEYNVSELAFGYGPEARANLDKLFLLPEIESAQIYDSAGRLFASRTRQGIHPTPCQEKISPDQEQTVILSAGYLEIFQPMIFREQRYGTLRLSASTAAFQALFDARLRALLLCLVLVLVLVIPIAVIVQRWISRPIHDLIGKVQAIAGGDLTIRAEVGEAGGEVASLCTSVNLMADALERRIREVEEARKLLQLVSDHIPAGVFWKDRNSVYVWANRLFAEVAGIGEPKNIAGKTDDDLPWKKEQIGFYRDYDRRVMETGKAELSVIEPLRRADGADIWLDTRKVPLHDAEGRVIGVLGSFIDVTDRIRLEEQLRHSEKMKAIGQLAGGVAHDFNNQLGGILGSAELLLLKLSDPTLRSYAEGIKTACLRSSSLIKQLLAFARKSDVLSAPVNMHQLLVEAAGLLQHSIDRRITVVQNLEAPDPTVMGDSGQLQNALLNLAINARDAMPDGGTLTFATRLFNIEKPTSSDELAPGRYLEILASDTGHGMTREVQSRLFEPFFTTKEAGKGTGLGLAAVYGTVKSHGGIIDVQSEVGRGTTFRILLPLASGLKTDTAGPNVEIAEIPVKAAQGHVLLVDDEEVVRIASRQMLEFLGYRVTVCSEGQEALACFEKSPSEFDLVILDLMMPRMSGSEVFEAIRRLRPETKVLVVSGFNSQSAAASLQSKWGVKFLGKPFLLNELRQTLEELLRLPEVPDAFPQGMPLQSLSPT